MKDKNVIIIGAGLAGLSCGCYCQMNGYRTRIFEHHSAPGGVAAAWKRKDYLIDGGIHFLMGHRPGQPAYELYTELGTAQVNRFLDLTTYGRFFDEAGGRSLEVTKDLDRLSADLKNYFPGDTSAADDLVYGARAMLNSGGSTLGFGKPPELAGRLEGLRQMWSMRRVFKYFTGKYARPAAEYAKDISDPFFRRVIEYMFMPQVPFWFVLGILGMVAGGQIGLLEGGSLNFVLPIEKRYRDLGGEVIYKAAVEEILVKENRAAGVVLADGSVHYADIVVSAADGFSTIFRMLGGRYADRETVRRYTSWKPVPPLLMVSYGVARKFNGEPAFSTMFLKEPLYVNNSAIDGLFVRIFNYGSVFAPPGKTVIQAEFETEWDYWNTLQKEDRPGYAAEKKRIAAEILNRLESFYPGISAQVEVTDVATPYTTWRYTRNCRGAYMGWLLTPETIMAVFKRTLPGLQNFYMAGQWVAGGSVPGCLYSGRHVAEILCREEGRRFETSTP